MQTRTRNGCGALAALAAFAALGAANAAFARTAKPVPQAVVAPVAAPTRALALTAGGDAPPELALRRSIAAQRAADAPGVVRALEATDFSRAGAFAGQDRAAFLLGQAYLALGSRERFESLAHRVLAWPDANPWTPWFAAQLAVLDAERDPARALDALAASPAGTPALAARRDALRGRGTAEPADTTTALGRELAGEALLADAAAKLSRGDDATDVLARVPAGTRAWPRARHLMGLAALEHGDSLAARARLAEAAADSGYAWAREATLARAALGLDAGDWRTARAAYESADLNWLAEREALTAMRTSGGYDPLWTAWRSGATSNALRVLDGGALARDAQRLAAAAATTAATSAPAPPSVQPPAPATAFAWAVDPPGPEAWRALASSARTRAETAYAAARAREQVDAERRSLVDLRRYLGFGVRETRAQRTQLAGRAARLDSLRRTLDAVDARLRAVRDEAARRVVARAEAIRVQVAAQQQWLAAMRHWHLEGPWLARPRALPAGAPGPDAAVGAEQRLLAAVDSAAASLAAGTPDLLARSYQQAWRPGLVDRAARQDDDAARSLAWAHVLEGRIDSTRTAAVTSPALRALEARLAAVNAQADSTNRADIALRARVAREAVERRLAALEGEREGVDYGLAAAAYGLSVRLDRPGGEPAGPVAHVAAAGDTTGASPEDAFDDPETVRWRETALQDLRAFLAQHPDSPQRGEMRFRLADVLVVDARSRFRVQMADYVRAQQEGRPAPKLPVLDTAPALALYRTMLAEDRGFAHVDAVLFNAGSLLADEGDPRAEAFLAELVRDHAESPFVQEAQLRRGDMRFSESRWSECVDLYAAAAQGADPTLRAIALYKKGWAHFNQEDFAGAGDAFRAVLDVYGAEGRAALHVDLEKESEQYLVHALARAGGAPAFARYFDQLGARPYEARVLRELGQHFRRYSLWAEAAATEDLALRRWPKDASALASAQRLVDTYARFDRAGEAREARLRVAPLFAPGGAWAAAQSSDSLRAAGASFARGAWLAVAGERLKQAREHGAREDWNEALALITTLRARFPDDPEAAPLELAASEASQQLGDWPGALAHASAAETAGPDSVAAKARWQKVAITDAWYESTREGTARGRTGLGREALARDVIARADELLKHEPGHPRAADLRWRQGNLAYAHGWWERAAGDFETLATDHAGDARGPDAAALRADALFRMQRFDAAGEAWARTAELAQRAGRDTLARRAAAAQPVCAFRLAEAAVAADSGAHARHAKLFEDVAERWPAYEHAPLAQYRAGLAWAEAGKAREAVLAFETLATRFPKCAWVRDARLRAAGTWERADEPAKAADAWMAFANAYPADSSAAPAWLHAADLYDAAKLSARADTLRLAYLKRWPRDAEGAMEILEVFANRELAAVTPARPVSTLLAAPKPVRGAAPAPRSYVAEYLKRAAAQPKLASRSLLAHVKFLEGEEAFAACEAVKLTQPLPASIGARQKRLDETLARFRRAVEIGDSAWTIAATCRIGDALNAFGVALESSERPADLQGPDLAAYEDVIFQQARVFRGRAQNVWSDLLRQKARTAPNDPWIQQARASLWGGLGDRFAFRPEADHPTLDARAPERPEDDAPPAPAPPRKGRGRTRGTAAPEETSR